MSKDKEILAHLAQRESQRHIASALHVSRNTVAKVAAAAKHLSLSSTEWKVLAEPELHQKLFRPVLLSRCRSCQTSVTSIGNCSAVVSR